MNESSKCALEDGFEKFRRDMLKFREDAYDFKDEMYLFKDSFIRLYDEQKNDHTRYIGALMEDNRRQTELLIEAMQMQFARFDRYEAENEHEHHLFDKRISAAEAIVM